MSPVDVVIDRLQGQKLRRSGKGWIACCPAHEDRSPSLTVSEAPSGAVLMHCFAGCSIEAVAGALGLALQDLFPADPTYTQSKPLRNRISASQALQIVRGEATLVWVAAKNLADGQKLEPEDLKRLDLAAQRINSAVTEAGL